MSAVGRFLRTRARGERDVLLPSSTTDSTSIRPPMICRGTSRVSDVEVAQHEHREQGDPPA